MDASFGWRSAEREDLAAEFRMRTVAAINRLEELEKMGAALKNCFVHSKLHPIAHAISDVSEAPRCVALHIPIGRLSGIFDDRGKYIYITVEAPQVQIPATDNSHSCCRYRIPVRSEVPSHFSQTMASGADQTSLHRRWPQWLSG